MVAKLLGKFYSRGALEYHSSFPLGKRSDGEQGVVAAEDDLPHMKNKVFRLFLMPCSE